MFLDLLKGRKSRVGLSLSPQSVEVLDKLTDAAELSRSDLIEGLMQGQLTVWSEKAQRVFQLKIDEAGGVAVEPDAPPTGDTSRTDRIAALESEIAGLKAQLATAEAPQATPSTSDAELAQQQQTVTALRQDIATLQSQLTQLTQVPTSSPADLTTGAAVASTSSDVVAKLQQQLLDSRAAYAELTQQHQEQAQEIARLQQALNQTQAFATIGESQLNRWRYQTFSR